MSGKLYKCSECKKEKKEQRFTKIEFKTTRVCKNCVSKDYQAKPKKSEAVSCKCMICDDIYDSDYAFGICYRCKKSESYENAQFDENYRVGS